MENTGLTELTKDQEVYYYWITEREKCRIGRETGAPKPWTTDPVLQNYRFCNVKREDDTVSKWITENWMKPNDGSSNMVFAMCVARLFNRITTLEMIGFPTFTNYDEFLTWKGVVRYKLKTARDRGEKIWTGAYLVSTNGRTMDKVDYILDIVLTPIAKKDWSVKYSRITNGSVQDATLCAFHTELMKFDGMGSFMAGQVVADLKFTIYLHDALDWWTWAPIGPGSRRGLNRYFGRPLEASISPDQVLMELNMVRDEISKRLNMVLAVHNVQNCFCEYDKMLRVMKGEGKPRSSYNGR